MHFLTILRAVILFVVVTLLNQNIVNAQQAQMTQRLAVLAQQSQIMAGYVSQRKAAYSAYAQLISGCTMRHLGTVLTNPRCYIAISKAEATLNQANANSDWFSRVFKSSANQILAQINGDILRLKNWTVQGCAGALQSSPACIETLNRIANLYGELAEANQQIQLAY